MNQRSTFAKRQREQNRNDKAKAKQERLAARRTGPAGTVEKGPPIDWDALTPETTTDEAPPPSPAATTTDDE